MILVAWVLRAFFILMPLIFIPIYVAIRCFIVPLFFGDGIAGVFRNLLAKGTVGFICGFLFLLVANVFYMRIFYFLQNAAHKFVWSMINRVDRFYDRILGGEYGKGCSTSAGRLIMRCIYIICVVFGFYCGFEIVGYLLWGKILENGLSWSAWMTQGGGERVNRWTLVIAFFLLFGPAIIYAIERPICGSLEKAGYILKTQMTNPDEKHIELAEENGVWHARPKSAPSLSELYKKVKDFFD